MNNVGGMSIIEHEKTPTPELSYKEKTNSTIDSRC